MDDTHCLQFFTEAATARERRAYLDPFRHNSELVGASIVDLGKHRIRPKVDAMRSPAKVVEPVEGSLVMSCQVQSGAECGHTEAS